MKYLKNFKINKNFKKYNISWYYKPGYKLVICEFLGINDSPLYKSIIDNGNTIIDVNKLYYYDNSNGLIKLDKFNKTDIVVSNVVNNNDDEILYESDSLEDCINNISIIFNSYKYNF